ncbi:hypothetical protein MTP99_011252 [Tenebrio molitor]|jgi:glutaredoxin|nr:hypothetical protein MTP99_011252 [Tenebrio molitor]CAH1369842.1 unnamed protein product [Tenebrio molitor]
MVIRVYISRTSGDIEVKQRQKRVLLILDSKNIQYEVVDIADDDNKAQKDFMQRNATRLAGTLVELNPVHPLPPQIFSDDEYCGDYNDLEVANENGELKEFLKLEVPEFTSTAEIEIK